jgi:hypothetical protein
MINSFAPAARFPVNPAYHPYTVRRILGQLPLDVLLLTLGDGFPVSLAITPSTLKLLSVISAIPASAGQAAAFETFGSILVRASQ